MSTVTNLIGRPAAWYDKGHPNGKNPEGKQYIGFICAIFPQVDPRVAPRVGIEIASGELISAPFDSVWVLTDGSGEETLLGKQFREEVEAEAKEKADGGTGKAPG